MTATDSVSPDGMTVYQDRSVLTPAVERHPVGFTQFVYVLPGVIIGLLLLAESGIAAAATPVTPSETRTASSLIHSEASFLISQTEPEVRQGDQGGLVEALQKRLTDLGYYDGPITGYFGEATEAAVIRFQQAQGLTADGIVGAGTANALRRAGTAPSTPRNNPLTLEVGDEGPAVETLQNQLTTLGYYDGPVTGYFGELTEAALIQFQEAQGLTADGVVGSATQSALDRALQEGNTQRSSPSASAPVSDQPDPNDGVWELGEEGSAVATIQRQLSTLGYYDGSIDGDFGPNTEASVMAFQRSQNLTADGKAGPNTTRALEAAIEARSAPSSSTSSATRVSSLPPTAATPSTSVSMARGSGPTTTGNGSIGASEPNVLAIQRQLQEQGFYDGELDGKLGPATRRAIQDAQAVFGLQDGDFGQ